MLGTTAAGTGTAVFKCDALDNLAQLTMPAMDTTPARNQYDCDDSTTLRLASLRPA